MTSRYSTRALQAIFIFVIGGIGGTVALADEDKVGRAVASPPAYRSECGSCHTPFPPGLLSAGSWRAVMGGLDKHFGSDASLDPATAADITKFLVANAGARDTSGADGKPLLRITDTRWFQREHRDGHDGITSGIFRSAAVKSPANCGACHRGAADGDFGERNIRIPLQPSR
ncbi:diheme cytochrome c [Azoarcus sp. KH32C]|uniref:diheme cytochrome c n=1 Tax=Azoarcus sp. KH32C TaxID=748247 RepID=UPI0002386436|nr:diheme cytochrome c [Azoarcus sp. KH32C]BAL25765.1 hypothetical protein AZKH_3476 [Azoarcus sp. KH32C]